MDLDDVIKILIPKSARKKIKKKLKKKSLGRLFKDLIQALATLFTRLKRSSTPQHQPSRRPTAVVNSQSSTKQGPFAGELRQAHRYQEQIAVIAQNAAPDSMAGIRLGQLSHRVADWVHMIEEVVAHAQNQQEDQLLAEERKQVPRAIKRLEKQMAETDDPILMKKLERTLANRRRQLEKLDVSARNRKLAALKVENTLAQLGIIYSQLRSGSFVSQTSGYERLSTEIEDEVLALDDYLQTLDELRNTSGTWN
jgi:citrate synthase